MKHKIGFSAAAFVAAFLLSQTAQASKCYVKEYASLGTAQSDKLQVAAEPAVTDQTAVDFTGGHAESAAFSSQTRYVRLWCDVQASYAIGAAPTATNAMSPLSATTPEYFAVTPGHKASFVANP